jgi:hypothetical protein
LHWQIFNYVCCCMLIWSLSLVCFIKGIYQILRALYIYIYMYRKSYYNYIIQNKNYGSCQSGILNNKTHHDIPGTTPSDEWYVILYIYLPWKYDYFEGEQIFTSPLCKGNKCIIIPFSGLATIVSFLLDSSVPWAVDQREKGLWKKQHCYSAFRKI